jgi:DNA-directed RNA polymerase subunit RPC12/RpoP
MHVAIQATATLADLDRFLRRAWLECCSHMSAFTIDDQRYSVAPLPEIPEKSMSVRVGEVLKPGSHIRYEYDFGSTTELDLTMMEEWNSKPERQPTQLLALNNPPVYACVHCGKPATLVSADADPEEALLCRRCGKQIGDPDMLLPLVNSPRTGVCAYTGPVVRIMRVPRTNRRAQRVPAEQP